MSLNGSISMKSLVKSRNKYIFETFKLSQNLLRIPFKLMHDMSVIGHSLLLCKSVYEYVLNYCTGTLFCSSEIFPKVSIWKC